MSKRIVLLSIILTSTLAIGAFWLMTISPVLGQTDAQPNAIGDELGFIRMNKEAKAARGGEESSIRELSDSIFRTFGVNTEQMGMANPFEERLIRAQVNFQKGASKGVSEINVVRMVNGLAKKFGAPNYAKTDMGEVRNLRMGMLSYVPDLLYGEGKRPKKEVGASIDSVMSPLEAAYVTVLLLKQKQYNEEYQRTPKERAAAFHKKHKGKQGMAVAQETERQLILDKGSPRKTEMAQVIARGFSTKSPSELMDLAHKSLDVLGIDR
jgi:hypothetical protein